MLVAIQGHRFLSFLNWIFIKNKSPKFPHLILLGAFCRNKMMAKSKYDDSLTLLLGRSFFTNQDAADQGIPRHALAYLVKKGILERIRPGIYRHTDYQSKVDFQWEHLAVVAASIPGAVICLISALCYYELTDQIMREVWIAIPHRLKVVKRTGIRVIRMRNTELGRTEIEMGEFRVRIFDRERCIVDAFRYLDKETALKALKNYLQSKDHKPQLKRLSEYAKALRVDLTPYILAFTT